LIFHVSCLVIFRLTVIPRIPSRTLGDEFVPLAVVIGNSLCFSPGDVHWARSGLYAKIAFAAGALPQTLMGELKHSPILPSRNIAAILLRERGGQRREGKGRGTTQPGLTFSLVYATPLI